MQAGVAKEVIAARIPSQIIEPRSAPALQQAGPAKQLCRQSLSQATGRDTCACAPAASVNGSAAMQEASDSSQHRRPGSDTLDAAEQHTSTPCQEPRGSSPAQQQTSPDLQTSAAAAELRPELVTNGGSTRHHQVAGLQWELPEGLDLEDCAMLWVGEGDAPALTQLLLMYSR
jgi:hypothetical protein